MKYFIIKNTGILKSIFKRALKLFEKTRKRKKLHNSRKASD